ncbi:MAG: hypothetical protein OHK0015_55480 [Chloroflexi bacterium OHK40]
MGDKGKGLPKAWLPQQQETPAPVRTHPPQCYHAPTPGVEPGSLRSYRCAMRCARWRVTGASLSEAAGMGVIAWLSGIAPVPSTRSAAEDRKGQLFWPQIPGTRVFLEHLLAL